jgi:hypothetical protein
LAVLLPERDSIHQKGGIGMSDPDMTPQEQYLLKEYDLAARLTYHIDELRNNLTSFFLTFAGVGGAGLIILVKGEQQQFLSSSVLAGLLLVIAVLGAIIVAILARCRRAQIEHFRIINKIRTHFLGKDYELWNVVQLSAKTLPKPNRRSGTYMWTALIMVVTCGLVALAAYLSLNSLGEVEKTAWPSIIAVLGFVASYAAIDRLYLRLAQPPDEITYSDNNSPDG